MANFCKELIVWELENTVDEEDDDDKLFRFMKGRSTLRAILDGVGVLDFHLW